MSNISEWNPWHGCHKISPGCQNCYVYRRDAKYDKDSSVVTKNSSFDLPIKKGRNKEYKLQPPEPVYTCFTSDFFLEDADAWRNEAWQMIKSRPDLTFLIITKRIHRFKECIPDDWKDGYNNVHICCTVENQDRANFRLPIFLDCPIKHKSIICEPLLGKINLSSYLNSSIASVVVGGESGNEARVCDFEWILDIREQCIEKKVPFYFKQTGAFFRKDGKIYRVKRIFQHSQARKSRINWSPNNK